MSTDRRFHESSNFPPVLIILALTQKNSFGLDYNDILGTYKLDVDAYIHMNKAIGFADWANASEERIKAEKNEIFSAIRVKLTSDRVIEEYDMQLQQGLTNGPFVKKVDKEHNTCVVQAFTRDPGGTEYHYYFRFYKKENHLMMTKCVMDQEVLYPLVKIDDSH